MVYDLLKRVDIVNRIHKEEIVGPQPRLRPREGVYFAFPFAASPPDLAYQIQNTWVRPNVDQLPGACREWFTTQNVVVARDAEVSIAWATPDAPLITLTDINRGLWLKHLEVKNAHVFSYVMNNYWSTNYKAAQADDFTFRYSITSGRRLSDADLARFDQETRSPLVAYPYYNIGGAAIRPVRQRMSPAQASFFNIDSENAQLSVFKQAEDGNGYILRLRETNGRKGVARLISPVFALATAYLSNGVEDNITPLVTRNAVVEIPLRPREFTTVRLSFEPSARIAGRRVAQTQPSSSKR